MDVNISFGDYQFNGSDREIIEWNDRCDSRIPSAVIPRIDGKRLCEGKLDGRVISVRGVVSGSDKNHVRVLEDDLKNALNKGIQKLVLFNDRFIMAQKKALSLSYVEGSAMRMLQYTVSFEAGSPFWEAQAESVSFEHIVVSPYEWSSANYGNAFTYPIIKITATDSLLQDVVHLENVRCGTAFKYRGKIEKGNTLIIDPAESRVENNGFNALAEYEGDLLAFVLTPGENLLRFTGAPCTIEVFFRPRWY